MARRASHKDKNPVVPDLFPPERENGIVGSISTRATLGMVDVERWSLKYAHPSLPPAHIGVGRTVIRAW